jgi:hypothetical protein
MIWLNNYSRKVKVTVIPVNNETVKSPRSSVHGPQSTADGPSRRTKVCLVLIIALLAIRENPRELRPAVYSGPSTVDCLNTS